MMFRELLIVRDKPLIEFTFYTRSWHKNILVIFYTN